MSTSGKRSEYYGDETVNIQLNSKNCVRGYLENKQSLLLLFDSGATKTLISGSCVNKSQYLSSLPHVDIKPIEFKIGNGDCLVANKAITFQISIQGVKIELYAVIAENLVGSDVLVGTSTLSQLRGSLDFIMHKFIIRSRRVYFMPLRNSVIHPGQTRCIQVRGKMPKELKNVEIILHSMSHISSHCPSQVLVKLKKNNCGIQVTNTGRKPLHLVQSRPVLYSDLNDFVHAAQVIDLPTQSSVLGARDNRIPTSNIQQDNLRRYLHLDMSDEISKKTPEEIIRAQILLDCNNCVLDCRKRDEVYNMLLGYQDAFSLYGEIGECPNFEVDIQLKDTTPFYIHPYPINPDNKASVDREFDKLVRLGVLVKGCSPYCSPCYLIRKPHSSDMRCVTDFRHLNCRVVTAQQHYLSLREVLSRLGEESCKVLSVIDLKSAFHTLPLSKKSQKYTGMCPYPGASTYMYRRLPMGLNVSPALWQQKLNDILSEIPDRDKFCVAIHDDILVYSRSIDEHARHVSLILEALRRHKLKVSLTKCKRFRSKLTYVGHIVSVSDEGVIQVQAMGEKCVA